MTRFILTGTNLSGLNRIERKSLGDNRGFLSRIFCSDELAQVGWLKPIAQINHTYSSKRGTVRGMHMQLPPNAEMKLVSCIRGEVWDVAVDVRLNSPTFLQWHAEKLSAENGRALLIPEGFAHGFQALTDDVELLYCHSASHNAESEYGLCHADPLLSIHWPLAITELSDKDAKHPLVTDKFKGVSL